MIAQRFTGLQFKLLRTVLAGAGAFGLAAFFLAYVVVHQRAMNDSLLTLEGLAASVERTVAIGVYAHDAVLLQEVISGLARHELVARVEVRDAQGQLLARHLRGRPEVPGDGADIAVQRPLSSPFDAKETLGRLIIVADAPRVLAAARHEALLLGGLVAGQAAVLALLLYKALARGVSRPIVQLAQALRGMTPGTSARLPLPRRKDCDEIDVLIKGANALLEATEQALLRERRLLAEMARMEMRYRTIFESSSAGIFVLDGEGRLVSSNPTVSRIVGLAPDALRGAHSEHFIDRTFGNPPRVREMVRQSKERRETISGDLALLRADGESRWVHCLISVQPSVEDLVEGVIYDITERKTVESKALYHSQHDALTGLKNRAGTLVRAQRCIATAQADGHALSLMMIDLDGFKAINDRHGHQAGDEVLVVCAQRMRAAVRRSTSLIGRMGGDEFLVVLEGLDVAAPTLGAICAELLKALRGEIELENGTRVRVGASIGVASLRRHGSDLQALIEAADQAMYAVKAAGKNSFAVAVSGAPAATAVASERRKDTAALEARPHFDDSTLLGMALPTGS